MGRPDAEPTSGRDGSQNASYVPIRFHPRLNRLRIMGKRMVPGGLVFAIPALRMPHAH
jgi:hypothetical protein